MREFKCREYLQAKTEVINNFFRANKLNAVVIGVSGGVDSAVALMLFLRAASQKNSPITYVKAIMMPIYGKGVSKQDEATQRGVELCEFAKENGYTSKGHFTFSWDVLDLTESYRGMLGAVIKTGFLHTNPWTDGQMASVLRTPMFYYQAAILQQEGYRSVVSGTTNRDEGSYIGFFGKASDGMVDIQPIADIHKSEVYEIAHYFNIPTSILNEKPKGDVCRFGD